MPELADLLSSVPCQVVAQDKEASPYWHSVLSGFPKSMVEATLCIERLGALDVEPLARVDVSDAEGRLIGFETKSLFPSSSDVRTVSVSSFSSKFPCEDVHVEFFLPALDATFVCVIDGHGGVEGVNMVKRVMVESLVRRAKFCQSEMYETIMGDSLTPVVDALSRLVDSKLHPVEAAGMLQGAILEAEACLLLKSS